MKHKKKRQGFAALEKARRQRIASLGGKAAHATGKAHRYTPEEARIAGKISARKSAQKRVKQRRVTTAGI